MSRKRRGSEDESIDAILRRQASIPVEWVPRYHLAPRNQADARASYLPDVTCAIDELRFNAYVAGQRGQHPRYHFSVAVPLALMCTAQALIATEEFMPEVPLDRDLTVGAPSDTSPHDFANYEYLRNRNSSLRYLRSTQDADRFPVGDTLFALSLQAIALHEEGHFLNGHLDPALGFCGQEGFREIRDGGAKISLDDKLTLRALELDADHYAIMAMLGDVFSSRSVEFVSHAANELARSPLGHTRFAASATMMLGLLLWQAEGGIEGGAEEDRTHPSPLSRLVHFAHCVSTAASSLMQTDAQAEAWNATVDRDTTVILNLFGLQGVHDFRPAADAPWQVEWRKTIERLLELKPLLARPASIARATVGVDPERLFPWDDLDLLRFDEA